MGCDIQFTSNLCYIYPSYVKTFLLDAVEPSDLSNLVIEAPVPAYSEVNSSNFMKGRGGPF